MSLAVLVPMLGRPEHVAPLLESIRATCDARVHWLITYDQFRGIGTDVVDAIRECPQSSLTDAVTVTIPRERGDYAAKINLGCAEATEDHIFTGASDLRFHPGWYEAACAKLTDGIGVVGTNDLSPRNAATHFLITREYAQLGTIDGQPGFFYEGYPHEWVDDEAIGTAQYRGAYAYAEDSIVEHRHPAWGKGASDATYEQAPQRMRAGRPLFMRRRRLWM